MLAGAGSTDTNRAAAPHDTGATPERRRANGNHHHEQSGQSATEPTQPHPEPQRPALYNGPKGNSVNVPNNFDNLYVYNALCMSDRNIRSIDSELCQ